MLTCGAASKNRVYVARQGTRGILVLDHTGKRLAQWNTLPREETTAVRCITVNDKGVIFIVAGLLLQALRSDGSVLFSQDCDAFYLCFVQALVAHRDTLFLAGETYPGDTGPDTIVSLSAPSGRLRFTFQVSNIHDMSASNEELFVHDWYGSLIGVYDARDGTHLRTLMLPCVNALQIHLASCGVLVARFGHNRVLWSRVDSWDPFPVRGDARRTRVALMCALEDGQVLGVTDGLQIRQLRLRL